jgi:hypothetical protein
MENWINLQIHGRIKLAAVIARCVICAKASQLITEYIVIKLMLLLNNELG